MVDTDVQQCCPYCHREETLNDSANDDVIMFIAPDADDAYLVAESYDDSSQSGSVPINFCPMCGRKI